jgi:sulfatase maturation enzyme AslB (radical SAM superfamily)
MALTPSNTHKHKHVTASTRYNLKPTKTMAAIIAGLRGGVTEDVTATKAADFSRELLAGRISRSDLASFLKNGGLPRFLSMVVNDTCNLQCRHCYLQTDRLGVPFLTIPEWERVVDSLCDSDVRMVCLSGKEVFFGKAGPQVLSLLQQARSENRGFFRLGAITNGTLLHAHRNALEGESMSYLDISMDGMRESHDAVRGTGSFDRTAANVAWLAPLLQDRLFCNTTLLAENVGQMPEIVTGMSRLGFHGMGFGFYLPQKYTDNSLILESSEAARIFESLHSLASIQVARPISVLIDLDTVTLDQMLAFLRSDWFAPESLKVDRMGELYNEYRFVNGVTLQFRITPYPTGIWKASRLNPDGSYLAAEDTVDAKSYHKRAIANIRDFDFDVEAMNRFCMESQRVEEILDEYAATVLPWIVDAAHSRILAAQSPSAVLTV